MRERVTTIAETGARFADFRPYVAAVDGAGRVAFAATVRGGGAGIFVGDGGEPTAVFEGRPISHPAFVDGDLCFYVARPGGGHAVTLTGAGEVAVSGGELVSIGPLGPTANRSTIGFRADLASGSAGIFAVARDRPHRLVAATGDRFARFEGLPVVDPDGQLVFRAAGPDGRELICREAEVVVETGNRFVELGRFPAVAGDGAVIFAATVRAGGAGVYLARGDQVDCAIAPSDRFETIRGAVAARADQVVFFATPPGGELGIYDDPDGPPILAVGSRWRDRTVTAFALNPVSINRAGQLAVRLELAGGAQAIVRIDR